MNCCLCKIEIHPASRFVHIVVEGFNNFKVGSRVGLLFCLGCYDGKTFKIQQLCDVAKDCSCKT